MSDLQWSVGCEYCHWNEHVETRQEGIALGHLHIRDEHGGADEWSFRVRGIRLPRSVRHARAAATVKPEPKVPIDRPLSPALLAQMGKRKA